MIKEESGREKIFKFQVTKVAKPPDLALIYYD